MKYFIIFAICFLIAGSITSGKFLPQTSRERALAISLIIFLISAAILVIWVLAPYYLQ